eukprot:TRINITY_DN1546_c0_g1_i1.p1 TRINITY_DN1546_c0_g1~~TRINITY_DN1546_c0_g1_i1.p1  ORF type:complete len:139 (-),score=22.19 TRINITY_DN1546_c0_g1_i1:170-538(-)
MSAQTQDPQDPFNYLYNLSKVPCFRRSLLTGLGAGSLFFVTSLLQKKPPIRAVDHFFYAFFPSGVISWFYCRHKATTDKERATRILNEHSHVASAKELAEMRAFLEKQAKGSSSPPEPPKIA